MVEAELLRKPFRRQVSLESPTIKKLRKTVIVSTDSEFQLGCITPITSHRYKSASIKILRYKP